MQDDRQFADQIRAHYPEGLTGIIAVGGTRTTFILDQASSGENDSGAIRDAEAYVRHSAARYFDLIRAFFDFGGQNLVLPLLSFQSFYERGEEYTKRFFGYMRWLTDEPFVDFYRAVDADPYFDGIDTLLHLPPEQPAHQMGRMIADFTQSWDYQPHRRKLIWEMAPIPLFSFWKAQFTMPAEAQAELAEAINRSTDLREIYPLLYRYYARAAYGTEIPIPHFYLGSNRNGTLKLRAMMPISMVTGGNFRMFFTPYPTLFTTRETLKLILEDLTFGKPLRALKADYSGQYTSELLESEKKRVDELRADPFSTSGLTRHVAQDDGDA